MEWNDYDTYRNAPIEWGWCDEHQTHVYRVTLRVLAKDGLISERPVVSHTVERLYELLDSLSERHPGLSGVLSRRRLRKAKKKMVKGVAIRARDYQFTEDE